MGSALLLPLPWAALLRLIIQQVGGINFKTTQNKTKHFPPRISQASLVGK